MKKEKMARSEAARKAAYIRWSRVSSKDRSKIMSKISSLGGKARHAKKLCTGTE